MSDNFAIFCRSCGFPLVLSAKYSHNCGESVKAENYASVSPTMTRNQEKVQPKKTMTLSDMRVSTFNLSSCSSALLKVRFRRLKFQILIRFLSLFSLMFIALNSKKKRKISS